MLMRLVLILGIVAAVFASVWFGGRAIVDVAKAWLAPILIENSWLQGSVEGEAPPPWPWADTRPVYALSVPRLNLNQYVLDGASGRALAFGPVASLVRNIRVLFGHRDTHFAFLESLRVGDEIQVQALNGEIDGYTVAQIAVRHEDDITLVQEPNADPLLMVTCYPFNALGNGGPMRYVVLAVPDDSYDRL